jgi:hypothetical protein
LFNSKSFIRPSLRSASDILEASKVRPLYQYIAFFSFFPLKFLSIIYLVDSMSSLSENLHQSFTSISAPFVVQPLIFWQPLISGLHSIPVYLIFFLFSLKNLSIIHLVDNMSSLSENLHQSATSIRAPFVVQPLIFWQPLISGLYTSILPSLL